MAEFIKVAELDELPDEGLYAIEVEGELVCLAKIRGTVCAFTDNCTHISGPLHEGELVDTGVTCPWHGAQFDVCTGKVLRGPARQDLYTYPVKIEGSSIYISLPEE